MEVIDVNEFQVAHVGDTKKFCKEILREKRVTLEMTQQQVADKAGIKLQQYQKFESGERNIMTCSFQIACRVIEALEMDITKFFHGDYVFGEGLSAEGKHYAKSGRFITDDIDV